MSPPNIPMSHQQGAMMPPAGGFSMSPPNMPASWRRSQGKNFEIGLDVSDAPPHIIKKAVYTLFVCVCVCLCECVETGLVVDDAPSYCMCVCMYII